MWFVNLVRQARRVRWTWSGGADSVDLERLSLPLDRRPADELSDSQPLDCQRRGRRPDDLAVLHHGVVTSQVLRLEELGPCPRGPRLSDDEAGRHVVVDLPRPPTTSDVDLEALDKCFEVAVCTRLPVRR